MEDPIPAENSVSELTLYKAGSAVQSENDFEG